MLKLMDRLLVSRVVPRVDAAALCGPPRCQHWSHTCGCRIIWYSSGCTQIIEPCNSCACPPPGG